jgi:Nitroreductase family
MTEAANPTVASGAGHTPASPRVTPIPASRVERMLAIASRAPSVHNAQPWRFSVRTDAIELYADPARKIHQDATGRQMLVSCGAALFGLRLAVRDLGRVPAVTLLPDPARPALLARVALVSVSACCSRHLPGQVAVVSQQVTGAWPPAASQPVR